MSVANRPPSPRDPSPPSPTPATPSLSLVGAVAGPHPKILDMGELLARRVRARRDGLAVVQCHGCFDIVHPGHIRHLRHAKAQGDILLVSITGDSQIAKGTGRPLIPEELRAENLAALDFVDWVYVEQRPTARELLDQVQPDIYVKGREYELNNDPRFAAERDAVIKGGGRVVFSSGDVVFSSTALIAALEHSVDPYHLRVRELLQRPELDGVELAQLIGRFRGKRILVVGETILDTYVLCDRPDIAGESPVMTLRPIERRQYDGGAAIIARHLAAMGASPVLVTGLPECDDSIELTQRLAGDGVDVRSIAIDSRVPEKQRFLVGTQKVMKLDLVERIELDSERQGSLAAAASDAAGGCDAAIIVDHGLGLLSHAVLSTMCPRIREQVGIFAGSVSGRRSSLRWLKGMDLLMPTEHDLRESYHLFDEGLSMVAWRLMSETGAKAASVLMGSDGLISFSRLPGETAPSAADTEWRTRLKAEHVPAFASQGIDQLGCEHAALAAATLSLVGEGTLLQGSMLAGIAAAQQGQRLGNTVISATDLRHGVARLHTAHLAYAPAEVIQSRTLRAATHPIGGGVAS